MPDLAGYSDQQLLAIAKGGRAPVDAAPQGGGLSGVPDQELLAIARSGKPAETAAPPAPPKTGAGEAFGAGVLNSGFLGFLDEIKGLGAAGGVDPDAPEANVGHILMGAYNKLRGDPEAMTRYDRQMTISRARDALLKQEHPVASFAGELAGGAAIPVGAAMQGATLPIRMGRGAAVGAALGGVSAAGNAEGGIAERALPAAAGTIVGFGVGGLAPPLVEAAATGVNKIAQPIAGYVRSIRDPEAEAARRVTGQIMGDVKQAPPGTVPGLTPQEYVQAPEARIMDLGGTGTAALAKAAANTDDAARGKLNEAIDPRFEGQAERFKGWLTDTFNFPHAQAQQKAIDAAASAANHPAYQRAFKESAVSHPGGLWDEGFEQISQAPAVQDAIRKASVLGANKSAREGFTPVGNPFTMDKASGRMVLKTDAEGNILAKPNLEFWDAVKKNLDKGPYEGRDFSRVLRAHIDELVPSYGDARAGAAHFFGAEDALEAGQKFVTSSLGNREARDALTKMSETERQLFQDGFVSRFVETLDKIPDRANVVRRIYGTPNAREKLSIALGPEKTRDLEAQLRIESVMDAIRPAVQGGGGTVQQWVNRGLATAGGGLGSVGTYNVDPGQMSVAAIAGGLALGNRKLDQRLARKIAEMLTSRDPDVLKAGARLVAKNESVLQAFRSIDGKLGSLTAQNTAGPAGQAIAGE